MDQDAKVERLLDMLRCAAEQLPEESMKDAEKLLSGRLLSKSLVKLAAELTGNDIKSLCDLISEAMDLTLWNQPGGIERKQQLWKLFDAWLSVLENEYGILVSRPEKPILESEESILIQLIKELQGPDGLGCTRQQLAEKLQISEKTLRTYLKRLNGKKDVEPWALGNQRVRVAIESRHEGRQRFDYMPDTLHPVVMQLNLTQAAYILKSLGTAVDSGIYGNEISTDLAADIWCQLSPYARKQIQKQFVGASRVTKYANCDKIREQAEAHNFGRFLTKLEGKIDHPAEEFENEANQLERFNGKLNLLFALKSGDGMQHTYLIQCTYHRIFKHGRFYLDAAAGAGMFRIVSEGLFERQDQDCKKIMDKHFGELVSIEDILKIEAD